MILVDTSVWVDHFRSTQLALVRALDAGTVLGHPWVLGELLLGGMSADSDARALMEQLPQAAVASELEVLEFIDRQTLAGTGVGFVDAGLLAAVRLSTDAQLWTRDRRLAEVAERLGVGMGAGLTATPSA